jgi:hypothetical protein
VALIIACSGATAILAQSRHKSWDVNLEPTGRIASAFAKVGRIRERQRRVADRIGLAMKQQLSD